MASKSKGSISIPPEIITDILYRLPAKSLGRFRCVSKDFLSLISDPKFIKTHLKNIKQNHIIFSDYNLLYSHPFHHHESLLKPTKFHLELDSLKLWGSCDGLVLVSTYINKGTLVVLNPTTRDFVVLPDFGNNLINGYKLHHEHSLFYTIYGFGYDSVSDDYKVVTFSYFLFTPGAPTSVYVHIYSLRTNTWRPLVDLPCDYSYGNGGVGVYVNGFIHWIVKNKSNGLYVIVAFSLADEKFSELPLPNLPNDVNIWCKKYIRLFVLDGKLAIFVKGVVWLMNNCGKQEFGTKIIIQGLDESPIFKQRIEPMVSYVNGKVLVANIDQMLIYDVEKGSFNGETVYMWNPENFTVEGIFVESLVSPKIGMTN